MVGKHQTNRPLPGEVCVQTLRLAAHLQMEQFNLKVFLAGEMSLRWTWTPEGQSPALPSWPPLGAGTKPRLRLETGCVSLWTNKPSEPASHFWIKRWTFCFQSQLEVVFHCCLTGTPDQSLCSCLNVTPAKSLWGRSDHDTLKTLTGTRLARSSTETASVHRLMMEQMLFTSEALVEKYPWAMKSLKKVEQGTTSSVITSCYWWTSTDGRTIWTSYCLTPVDHPVGLYSVESYFTAPLLLFTSWSWTLLCFCVHQLLCKELSNSYAAK